LRFLAVVGTFLSDRVELVDEGLFENAFEIAQDMVDWFDQDATSVPWVKKVIKVEG
jgi:hypothetical protein